MTLFMNTTEIYFIMYDRMASGTNRRFCGTARVLTFIESCIEREYADVLERIIFLWRIHFNISMYLFFFAFCLYSTTMY